MPCYEKHCNVCAANGYIARLEKASVDIAKDIMLQELRAYQDTENASLNDMFEDIRDELVEWYGIGTFRA